MDQYKVIQNKPNIGKEGKFLSQLYLHSAFSSKNPLEVYEGKAGILVAKDSVEEY